MNNENVRRTISIFLLLTLYVGLCFDAAALEVMAVGDPHELEGGYSIAAAEADVERGRAVFVLYKEGIAVAETVVSSGDRFGLNDGDFYFEAVLDYVYRSEDTIMVKLTDYNWEWREPPAEVAPTPAPTPYPVPDFSLYLIIFLVCCLAIGLSLIFIIYRKGKPPSKDHTQKTEEYRAKMEEWEKEGYDISELKEALEGKK